MMEMMVGNGENAYGEDGKEDKGGILGAMLSSMMFEIGKSIQPQRSNEVACQWIAMMEGEGKGVESRESGVEDVGFGVDRAGAVRAGEASTPQQQREGGAAGRQQQREGEASTPQQQREGEVAVRQQQREGEASTPQQQREGEVAAR